MEMIELNPQNRSKRLLHIVGWTMLSLLLIAAMIALTQEFRWRQSAGEAAVAAAGNVPKDEFERRVHDYLLAHPEVIGEAIHRLERSSANRTSREDEPALNRTPTRYFAIRPILSVAIRTGTLHWSSSLITAARTASKWLRSSRKQKDPTRTCALSLKSFRYWG
jgi:Copper resistance protein ScsC N-terminal domain